MAQVNDVIPDGIAEYHDQAGFLGMRPAVGWNMVAHVARPSCLICLIHERLVHVIGSCGCVKGVCERGEWGARRKSPPGKLSQNRSNT